ncbi:MAG: sulfur transferase domain-containing protein [Acidobacteriota bacterium]|nr:sulfur transferase domain-containing protein [Acidobacteriota bacterium]
MFTMLALVVAVFAQTPSQAAAPDIRNFLQVTPDFCTGAQPRPEHFAMLKSRGVKTVLNLRVPEEHRAEEEEAAVEAAGLKYINLPVAYRSPTDADVDAFLELTDDPANRPMFVHCTAGIRVGAFWLIRRVVRDGMTWDAALEEARTVGLVNAPHLEEFAKAYLATHPPQK